MKSLRNIKTEALLVYIRTVCEEYLEKIKNKEYILDMGHEICNKEISDMMNFLEENLTKTIPNAYDLAAVVAYTFKERKVSSPHFKALIFYYNILVIEFEKNLKAGDKWLPEQIILALLSEWIFEEEKSVNEFPFLKEIDYFKLLGYFEFARNNEKKEELKSSVKLMFDISSSVIKKLKNAKFKINSNRKSKTRP